MVFVWLFKKPSWSVCRPSWLINNNFLPASQPVVPSSSFPFLVITVWLFVFLLVGLSSTSSAMTAFPPFPSLSLCPLPTVFVLYICTLTPNVGCLVGGCGGDG